MMILALFILLLAQRVGAEPIEKQPIKIIGGDKPTCEQRMREAMRAMDEYVREAYIPKAGHEPWRSEFFNSRKQWDQTVRECVGHPSSWVIVAHIGKERPS